MQIIRAIFFEPVGCLAEFPSEEFDEIAVRVFDRQAIASQSGSESYWHVLDLMQTSGKTLSEADKNILADLETRAAGRVSAYEDVMPALSELKAMGTHLAIATSLSSKAVTWFVEKFGLAELFSEVWNRDNAGGIRTAPVECALHSASLEAGQAMLITDTAEGLKVANSLGVNSILMMNDPDEAMRLASHNPSGGIVSLHELPDFIRFVAAENAR
jgi:beta-phosphoglucomutase-like phosphatase (HAD superfamily)